MAIEHGAQRWALTTYSILVCGCFLLLLFSYWVMANSLQPHELQHTRLPCPSLSPCVCSNLCPLSQWCHPTISSSVIPFSCIQSCPASGSFLIVSSSHQVAKVLEFPFQHQSFQWIFRTDSFRIHWFDLLTVQETLKSLHHSLKASVLWHSAFFMV